MIKVSIFKQSNYSVSASKVKGKLIDVLTREGIVSDFSVSIAFVGEQKMAELVKKYYKGDPEGEYIHPILTFASGELNERFVLPAGETPDLGEIIISYPEAVKEANETGKLVEEVILPLVEHGAMHLMGKHHD